MKRKLWLLWLSLVRLMFVVGMLAFVAVALDWQLIAFRWQGRLPWLSDEKVAASAESVSDVVDESLPVFHFSDHYDADDVRTWDVHNSADQQAMLSFVLGLISRSPDNRPDSVKFVFFLRKDEDKRDEPVLCLERDWGERDVPEGRSVVTAIVWQGIDVVFESQGDSAQIARAD